MFKGWLNSVYILQISLLLLAFVVLIVIIKLRQFLRIRKDKSFVSFKQPTDNRYEPNREIIAREEEIISNILEQKTILQDQLFKIIDSARLFALELDIDSVCEIIFEEIDKFFFVQSLVFLFWDKTINKLCIKYSRGLKEHMAAYIKGLRLNIGESISGLVAKNRAPLLVSSFDNEPYYQRINKEKYFCGSFISLPVLAKDELLGVINVVNKRTGKPFTKEDLRLIDGIVAIGSVALKNIQLNKQIQEHYINVIITLAKALDARDHYTKSHSENVEKFSVLIAQEMGLSNSEIEHIRKAALLHDIGKIAISDSILKKTSALTEEEYEIIKKHPQRSEEIISAISFLKDSVKIVRHHHERYDGKGYPDGIRGTNIELGARIINVADSFDAMTSDRTYRKALNREDAIQKLIKGKGTQFDPEVVEAFLRIIKRKQFD